MSTPDSAEYLRRFILRHGHQTGDDAFALAALNEMEARAERAEAALRRIANLTVGGLLEGEAYRIARAALEGTPKEDA